MIQKVVNILDVGMSYERYVWYVMLWLERCSKVGLLGLLCYVGT